MAQGSALVRLRLDEFGAAILARQELDNGLLLDLVGFSPRFYVLTERGVLSLELAEGDSLPRLLDAEPGGGQAFAVRTDYIAVALREAGLRLIQIAPDGTLQTLSVLDLPGEALDVAFSPDGMWVYLAAGKTGLHLVNLSDPTHPFLAGTLPQPTPVQTVAAVGALLAIGSGGEVALIDPVSGQEIGRHAPLKDGQRLALDPDGYAYVADATDGLKILWLAAPDRPVQIYGERGQPASDVLFESGWVYLVGPGGLRILDVGNRFQPLEIARLDLPGQPQGLALGEGYAYVALGGEGVAVVNLENQSAPRLERRIPLDAPAHALVYDRGRVYVAADSAGLVTINAAEPGHEVLESTLVLPGVALDIERRGRALYVAGGEGGLYALDITHPETPSLAGVVAPEAGQRYLNLTIEGSRAYVSFGAGFAVLDINRPHAMGRLATVRQPALHVIRRDIYLYALGPNQIGIYNARATADPILLRMYHAPTTIAALTASSDRLFLTHRGSGPDLVVLGVGRPDYPVELENVGVVGDTLHAGIFGEQVWLGRGYGGLARFDLTEGGALIRRGLYHSIPEITRVAVGGGYVLAGGRTGWTALVRGSPENATYPVLGMAADADRIAITAGEAGLFLYVPDGVGEFSLLAHRLTDGPAVGVALAGGHVYAALPGGLAIFDGQYLNPVRLIPTSAPPTDLIMRGEIAYLILSDGTLAAVQIGDPAGGIRLRSTVETRQAYDLIPGPDGVIYGLAGNQIMRLDLSNPDRLSIAAQGTLPAPAERGVFVESLLAAFSVGEDATLYDLTLLEDDIIPRGRLELAEGSLVGGELIVNGPVAYVAYGAGGLGLRDIREPGPGHIFHAGETHSLLLNGATLFASGGTQLTVWDITDPFSPRQLAAFDAFAPINHVDSGPSNTLILSHPIGASIVAWDGAAFTQRGMVSAPASVERAVQIGDRLVMALQRGGLHIADVGDPAVSDSLFTYTSPSGQTAHDLLPLADGLLLASWESGIDVLDVSAVTDSPHQVEIVAIGDSPLHMALSTDRSMAAVALGSNGVALLNLADPLRPQVAGLVGGSGDSLAAALDETTLYVAEGTCGLRVFDVSNPADPREVGYWRSTYAADVAVQNGLVYLADGNQLLTLRYEPALPAQPPPVSQLPRPADGAGNVPFDTALTWGPPADPCNPLIYDVYFGQSQNPPLVGQVIGSPELIPGELVPSRAYYWRVEVADRQGDRVSGPVWRFTTISGDYADTVPPAPPPFEQFAEKNPGVPLTLAGLVALIGVWALARRLRQQVESEPDVPEWYSTGDEE